LTSALVRRAQAGPPANEWFFDTEFERDSSWPYGDFLATDVSVMPSGFTFRISWTWSQDTEVGTATATFTRTRDACDAGALAMQNMARDRASGIYTQYINPRFVPDDPNDRYHTYYVLLHPVALWKVEASTCSVEVQPLANAENATRLHTLLSSWRRRGPSRGSSQSGAP
jgi:hypothetical protein